MVYDIFMMIGEVGGMRDFLILGLAPLFGLFSNQFLMASVITKLFRINDQTKKGRKRPIYRMIEPHYGLLIAHACSFSRFFRDRLGHRRALIEGSSKIDSSLDVVRLMRQLSALSTLQKLLLTR